MKRFVTILDGYKPSCTCATNLAYFKEEVGRYGCCGCGAEPVPFELPEGTIKLLQTLFPGHDLRMVAIGP